MINPEDDQPRPARAALRWAWLLLAPILVIGTAGFAFGMIAGARDAGGEHSAGFYIALALAGAILLGAAWLTLRLLPHYRLPRSPRMRQGRQLLYASAFIGVVIGVAAILLQNDDPQGVADMVMGRADLSPALAMVLVAGMIVSLVLSVRWHRLLDEHERAAYDFGAVVAVYVYFTLSVIWWVLWRAALVPAPDGVAIFIIVTAVWMLGWLIRRFR